MCALVEISGCLVVDWGDIALGFLIFLSLYNLFNTSLNHQELLCMINLLCPPEAQLTHPFFSPKIVTTIFTSTTMFLIQLCLLMRLSFGPLKHLPHPQ